MKHLLNAAQHAATREELQATKAELKGDIAGLRTELKALSDKTDTLRADLISMEYKLTVRLGGIMVAGIGVIAALTKL